MLRTSARQDYSVLYGGIFPTETFFLGGEILHIYMLYDAIFV